jgi:hypothetical protein
MRKRLALLPFVVLYTLLGVARTSASPTPSNLQATIDALRTEFTTPTPTTATPSLSLYSHAMPGMHDGAADVMNGLLRMGKALEVAV